MQFTAAVEIGDSLQRGLDELVAFLPRLVGFLIILLIGWLIARAVKALVTRALQGVGLDRAMADGPAGPHIARVMPDARPSALIGTIAFWFLFLGAIAIAVSQLGIQAFDNFVQEIVAYLPNVVVAILIFVLAGRLLEDAYQQGRARRAELREHRAAARDREPTIGRATTTTRA